MSIIRRLLLLIILIALASGATAAYFSDSQVSLDNKVTAGTLKIGTPVNIDFNVSNAAPGGIFTGDKNPYDIGNKGTVNADHVEITVTNTVTDLNNNADPDIDEKIILNKLLYGSFNVKSAITGNAGATSYESGGYGVRLENGGVLGSLLDASGNITLNRWESYVLEIYDVISVDSIPDGLAGVTSANFDVDLMFNSTAGNEYQGDSLNITFSFTLNQHSSQ